MKKSSKELLFERMHYMGMPKKNLNEGEMTPGEIGDYIEPSSEEDYPEAPSYQVKLDNISRNAAELHDIMKSFGNLPAWVQDKITISEHDIKAIRDWAESKAHGEKYGDEEGAPEEMPSDDVETPEMETGTEDMEGNDLSISDEDMEELTEARRKR